jgi:hypothetical protein
MGAVAAAATAASAAARNNSSNDSDSGRNSSSGRKRKSNPSDPAQQIMRRNKAPKSSPTSRSSLYRRASGGSGAAGAAAAPPPPGAEEEKSDLFEAFMEMLLQAAPDGSSPGGQAPEIDVSKAHIILEATAGNIALAVNLYWDDHFASASHHHHQQQQHQQRPALRSAAASKKKAPPPEEQNEDDADQKKPVAARTSSRLRSSSRNNLRGSNEEEPPDNNGSGSSEEEAEEDDEDYSDALRSGVARRLRRSLERDFRAAERRRRGGAGEANDGDDNNNDDDDDDNAERAEDAADDSSDDMEQDDEEMNDVLNAAGRPREERALIVHDGNGDAFISVSDDEVGGGRVRLRAVRGFQNARGNPSVLDRIRQEVVREAAEAISKKVLKSDDSEDVSRKSGNGNDGDGDDNPDDYISDSDWLAKLNSFRSPLKSLWGKEEDTSNTEGTESPQNNNGDNNPAGDANNDRNDDDNNNNNNVIMLDDDDDDDDDEDSDDNAGITGSGIPYTWLHAGFHLSECGTGLSVIPPKLEDIEIFTWRQQPLRHNNIPPPYYCKATTSILSIVTALLYTGASIQGNEINCLSGRKPWAELTLEEKKREFEGRLTDALTSLLFIAAQASLERKKKACHKFQKLVEKNEDKSAKHKLDAKDKKMKRRLNLIPTCVWEEELSSTIVPRLPGMSQYRHVKIKTSLTNIHDIKKYVMSNIRAFTSKGGVALLLETIIRIHGSRTVSRLIQKARSSVDNRSQSTAASKGCFLVRCTCESRREKLFEQYPPPAKVRNDQEKLVKLLTPPGNQCISMDLLTLILTGHAKSNWKDCSPKGLGFGILTDKMGEVGNDLARPEKPVWILQGESCFSLLIVEEEPSLDMKTIAKIDSPRTSMKFCHWNTWYGESDKSSMRLVTGSNVPETSKELMAELQQLKNALPSWCFRVMVDRRRRTLIDQISLDQHNFNEREESEHHIRPDELDRIKIHEEDQKLYPSKHRIWRYDMGDEQDSENQKPKSDAWTPYHRLTSRQRRIIEIKLGPKINRILWTRWPGATIGSFTPNEDPVV